MKLFRISFLFIFLIFEFAINAQTSNKIALVKGWKFTTENDAGFASPDFNDVRWQNIAVDKPWEKQGIKHDGFAWYRIRVIIPSSLKDNAELKDSVIFNMGKIDDFDQTFLNGSLIGVNLSNVPANTEPDTNYKNLDYSYWNNNRRYSLSVNDPRIKWDAENVIAVRVYDWNGLGGIFSGDLYIGMPDLSDYFHLENNVSNYIIKNNTVSKTIKLRNSSHNYELKGKLSVVAKNKLNQKHVLDKVFKFDLNGKEEIKIDILIPRQDQSSVVNFTASIIGSNLFINRHDETPYILTPPVAETPKLNGAPVYGERPGKPFLYRMAATGKRPMKYSAKGLPDGLEIDGKTGIITGAVESAGTYKVALTAENSLGKDEKTLTVKIGAALALTPPMGWNSWNVWGLEVDHNKVYAAAEAFVNTGLADHGWTFINIDDGWEIFGKSDSPKRTAEGKMLTNEKFPDMKSLGDKIHSLGLKFGIYSSPGDLTCGGYAGSLNHEEDDAESFSEWGIDYLKYDLCGYRNIMKDQNDPAELKPPYIKMHKALLKQNRDIVYSICEYGNGKVWEWGEEVGGNLWRTTGDIWDEWERLKQIGFSQVENAKYNGPGHWNDPDMLVVGWVGWSSNLHPSRLTPDEQYTHITLWSLLSAPLLIGCDLTKLDNFTLNLLTNDEVIAIDQDPLGKQATPVLTDGDIQVWKKELSDGSYAIGIFNLGNNTKNFTLYLENIGLPDSIKARNIWKQKDIGFIYKGKDFRIPSHGTLMLKLSE
ncbi:MAG: alpha-galactosidase [Chlorobi bacterium]|nr:alpha-galactosidase [Chlorobiota bacterium]